MCHHTVLCLSHIQAATLPCSHASCFCLAAAQSHLLGVRRLACRRVVNTHSRECKSHDFRDQGSSGHINELEKRGFTFLTNKSHCIVRVNVVGLGWWNPNGPQNPEYLPPVHAPTLCSSPESTHTPFSNCSENLSPTEPTEPINTNTSIDVNILTTALTPIVSLQGTLPLTSDAPAPVIIPQITAAILSGQNPSIPQQNPTHAPLHPMSAAATRTGRSGGGGGGGGTAPGGGATPAPNLGGLQGIPPTIFSGDHSRSDTFLCKFKHYK